MGTAADATAARAPVLATRATAAADERVATARTRREDDDEAARSMVSVGKLVPYPRGRAPTDPVSFPDIMDSAYAASVPEVLKHFNVKVSNRKADAGSGSRIRRGQMVGGEEVVVEGWDGKRGGRICAGLSKKKKKRNVY